MRLRPFILLKSNGPHRSKNLPVKFGFTLKTVSANIAKKLPLQCCSKPLLIPFFNFSHKWPTFAFTGENGYTHSAFGERWHTAAYTAKQGRFGWGVVSLPSERSTRFGNPAWPDVRTANFAAFGAWSGVLPKNTESLRNSDALMRVAVPQASRPRWAAQPLLWSSWLSCFCLKPLLQTALRHGTMVSPNRNP